MTYPTVRALTTQELATLRSDGQYTKIKAIIFPQQAILNCQCSGSIAKGNDQVVDVPITILSGSHSNVVSGMTGYVGTAQGLSDLGMVRVKSCSSAVLHVARVSSVNWQTNVFITIVDDFGLWQKLPTVNLNMLEEQTDLWSYMDDDVVYANQNTAMNPIPIMGPNIAVPLSSGSITLNGSNSYTLDGSTISSYAWTVRSGSAASGGSLVSASSSIATFVPAHGGSYTIQLTITSSAGVTSVGHRSLYVYDTNTYAPLDQLQVDTITGDRDDQGWTADITMWGQAGLSTVRDRAKVILIAEDYYSGSAQSIGQYAAAPNEILVGWIQGETIQFDREKSTVKFTVSGPQFWLKQSTGPSTFLLNVYDTSKAWTDFQNLTFDKCVYHFFYWRSTAIEVLDIYRCNNARIIAPGMTASIGAVLDQLKDTGTDRLFVFTTFDKYGRFIPYIDPNMLPLADRSSVITVQPVADDDLTEQVNLQRTIVSPYSQLETAAFTASNNGAGLIVTMARTPGSYIYERYGVNDQNDRLLSNGQADTNILTGMLFAKRNNEYAEENLTFAQINHMLDVTPGMYILLTVSAVSNVREISFTDKKFIITRIQYKVDAKTGKVSIDVQCEGETSGPPGHTIPLPQEPDPETPVPPDPNLPVYPIWPTPYPPVPPYVPKPPILPSGSACRAGIEDDPNGPFTAQVGTEIRATDKLALFIYFPCFLRPHGDGNASYYAINANFLSLIVPTSFPVDEGDLRYQDEPTDDWYEIYAIDTHGARIATAIHDPVVNSSFRSGSFDNSVGMEIMGFEIAFNSPEWMNIVSCNPIFEGDPFNNCGLDYGFTITQHSDWDYDTDGGVHVIGQASIQNSSMYGWAYSSSGLFKAGLQMASPGSYYRIKGYAYRFPDYPCDRSNVIGGGYVAGISYNDMIVGKLVGMSKDSPYPNGMICDSQIAAGLSHIIEAGFGFFQPSGDHGGPQIVSGEIWIDAIPSKAINIASFSLFNICKSASQDNT